MPLVVLRNIRCVSKRTPAYNPLQVKYYVKSSCITKRSISIYVYIYIHKYGQASGVTSVRTDSTPHWCPLRFTKSSRVKAPKASRILNSWCIPLCHIELCYLSYILFKICYCPLSHSSWRFCKCIQKCDTMYHLYTFDYIRNRTGIYYRLCCRL